MGKLVGWIVAAILLLAGTGVLIWGMGQRMVADDLRARLERADGTINALKENLEAMGRRVDAAAQEIRDLEARVAKLQPPEAGDTAVPAAPGASPDTDALTSMIQALQKPQEGQNTGENPFSAMFSGEKGKNMARMSAQMSVPTMYGELFKELNLPAEDEAKVREILTDAIAEQVSQGFDAMNKKSDPEAMRKNVEAQGQKLRAQLATVLTADELAVFDEYEAGKERRMLESGIDMQLSMFANGLTEENRTMFRDVIVEELSAQGEWVNNPEVYANPGSAIDRQIAAFRAARDRVVPVIAEDQVAQVDAFVDQMETMMNAQRELLENLMGAGKPQDPPAAPESPPQ